MRFTSDTLTLFETVVARTDARGWVTQPLAPGLVRALAWDAHGELRPVTKDRVARSGQPEAAFWAQARRATGPAQLSSRTTAAGAVIWSLYAGNPWVSARLLDPDALARAIPQEWYDPVLGILVAAPTCSSVHVHLLGTCDDAQAALVDLGLLALAGYATAKGQPGPSDPVIAGMLPRPRPLAPTVYWAHDGVLVDVPIEVDLDGMQVHVRPSPAFQEAVLDRL